MPIYEYRCSACGFKNEHLQKLSDARLTVCPQCGQATYEKMLTAAGFQLKGSGWYATDFKGGSPQAKSDDSKEGGEGSGKSADKGADKSADKGADKGSEKSSDKSGDSASTSSSSSTSTPSSSPSSSPASSGAASS
jgi:putative FmdB family regulatory protein